MTRILVVEDNVDLAVGLRNNLEIEGYDVDVAQDGEAAVKAVTASRPDLVVLDLMLPGMDGFRVLRELRGTGLAAPVLMLTARAEEADKVRALRLGADDYVVKPFGLLELLARVEALLRRAGPAAAAQETIVFGDVVVNRSTRSVAKGGAAVLLTPMEFDLLIALISRGGRLATRLELLTEVWGHAATVLTRTVDTHVAELRRKLEDDPAQPRYILTVRKAGYRFEPAASPSPIAPSRR